MLIGITTNIGLLSLGALTLYFSCLNSSYTDLTLRHKILVGVCFGALSVVVLELPVQLPIGATFDTRAAPAVLSGFFAGPIGGVICAAIAGAARFHVGGPVVIGGTLSPFIYAAVGAAAGILYNSILKRRPGVPGFLALSIVATISVLPCFFIDQGWAFGISILSKAWYVFLAGNVVGILLLGLVCEQIRKNALGHSETARALLTSDLARASAEIAVWRYDFLTDRLEWDPAMFRLYGVAPETFNNTLTDWAKCVVPEDIDRAADAFTAARDAGASFEHRFRIKQPDGSVRLIQAHAQFYPDPTGQFSEVFGVNWDITDEIALQDALIRSENEARERSEELEVTFSSMKQGVSVFDADGVLKYANQQVCEILGLPKSLVQPGMPFRALLECHKKLGNFASDPEKSASRVQSIMNAGKVMRTRAKLGDGRVVVYTLTPKPNGGWVETVEDITENAAAEARIMTAAETDALTGLGNRLAFNKTLERVVRNAPLVDHGYALLLIDLNNFKSLNDTHGHHIGDKVLQEIAQILKRTCGADDFAARLGGDEFALIVQSPQPGSSELLAYRLSTQFAQPIRISSLSLKIGAAIGIAPISAGIPVEDVLVNADAAMYKAKSENLNHYKIYDNEIAAEMRSLRKLQGELANVVAGGKLETYFQPVIGLQDGKIKGAEALVRWRRDDGSFVPPVTFVPLAEDAGLIREIGFQMLKTSARVAAALPKGMTVSVNVSPKQLGSGVFLEQVVACLRECDLSPDALELEVTENILMDRGSAALEELMDLKQQGVRVALDDFGTGYSSLSYLHHFQFDKLKIDRSFVMPMETDPTCSAIVYTILNLCQNLNLDCTAEGIETDQQRKLLAASGCRLGQGYFFNRPVPENEFMQLVEQDDCKKPMPSEEVADKTSKLLTLDRRAMS